LFFDKSVVILEFLASAKLWPRWASG
jgi:hypothetical protein